MNEGYIPISGCLLYMPLLWTALLSNASNHHHERLLCVCLGTAHHTDACMSCIETPLEAVRRILSACKNLNGQISSHDVQTEMTMSSTYPRPHCHCSVNILEPFRCVSHTVMLTIEACPNTTLSLGCLYHAVSAAALSKTHDTHVMCSFVDVRPRPSHVLNRNATATASWQFDAGLVTLVSHLLVNMCTYNPRCYHVLLTCHSQTKTLTCTIR